MSLRNALLRSKVLLPVLSATYFRRPWCLAEWETMRERERLLGMRTQGNPGGVIFPVVFFDGHAFPPDAQTIQQIDFRPWNICTPGFVHTAEYIQFVRTMQSCATKLAPMLDAVPAWDAAWPVCEPAPPPAVPMDAPRL
jgi:hypothetical protein